MNVKQQFRKHFAKLRNEAWVRALLAGLIVGFVVGFVAAILTWFADLNGLWIPAAAILAATGVSMPIYYAKKFRPTAESSARRIDRLGLEERLITMVEFADDDSFVANVQRRDAQEKLEELETNKIKVRVPRKTIIALSITGVFSIGMYAVAAMSTLGLLPDGMQWLDEVTPEEPIKYVSVTYEALDGGTIEGEFDQLIPLGSDTSLVVAVADEGYEFQGWDDQSENPDRFEKNVLEDVVYVAIFQPIEEGEPSEDGESSEEEDQQQPQESQSNDQSQQQDENSDSPPTNNGKYEESNQILDGETYYREHLEYYRNLLLERLESEGATLTDEERAIIESYLEVV